MFCHGELTLLKPGPRYLTTFYLRVSVGGALGALLVGIVAPNTLSGYYELGITLTACALLLYVRMLPERWWIAAGALAVMTATATFTSINIGEFLKNTRVSVRNFYGVVRTRDYYNPAPFRVMLHGGINHGGQLLDPESRRRPSSYFGPTSGYGRAFASLPDGPRRIGVIGLGAGAIAVYARRGDTFRFYEIDPQVAAVALKEFTFLSDCPAQVDIVLGDGRLSLEREASQGYDLLAIDAFSGDSIPMHLVTREAMAIYMRHLKPGGVIVFQATNRYVDLAPVVERLAAEFGMKAVMVTDISPEDAKDEDYWVSDTDQIIVTNNARVLGGDPLRSAAVPVEPRPGFRIFTDDFHNLLRVLKW
jgi:SAM-dependent methyltransferase